MPSLTRKNYADTNEVSLARIGHDLRTPLTPALLVISSLLENPAIPDELRPDLAVALEGITQEVCLIQKLLDAMQIQRGQLWEQTGAVDLHAILVELVIRNRKKLEIAGLTFTLDPQAEFHHVDTNARQIHDLVEQFLENAVDFGSASGLISITTGNSCDGWVEIVVNNPGAGCEVTDLDRPRQSNFETEPSRRACSIEATSRGLEVVQRLARAHGGTVEVQSAQNGSGATFRLALPTVLAAQAMTPPSVTFAKMEGSPLRSLRILLVEDNPVILRFLGAVLRDKGHEVFAALDLAAARQFARTRQFDLLLSDIELPDGTGLEFVRELAPQGVPAVAISAFGSPEDIQLSLEAGFFEHLTKPINVTQLGQALVRATQKIASTATRANAAAFVDAVEHVA